MQSLNKTQHRKYLEKISKASGGGGSQEYEKIARSIIEKGGVKSMSVAQISETSKVIKEKMDLELVSIIESFDLTADFFITSHSLRKLWTKCFHPEQFRVELDAFIQAFDCTIQADILTSSESQELATQRKEMLKWLFSAYSNPEPTISLDNIINLSDFIELGTLFRMFEADTLDECVEKLRNETAIGLDHQSDETLTRIQESINAKHAGNSAEMVTRLHQRTAYLRTRVDVKQNQDMILLLHVFGVKSVYLVDHESWFKDPLNPPQISATEREIASL